MANVKTIAYAAEQVTTNSRVGYNQGPTRTDLQGLTIAQACDGRYIDTDCSAFATWCAIQGGALPSSTQLANVWTGNQEAIYTANGASVLAYPGPNSLKEGDILWIKGHTAVVGSHGAVVCEAWLNEKNTITGGTRGKQASWETRALATTAHPYAWKWTKVFRFPHTATSHVATTKKEELSVSNINTILAELKSIKTEVAQTKTLASEARAHAQQALIEINRVKKGADGTVAAQTLEQANLARAHAYQALVEVNRHRKATETKISDMEAALEAVKGAK